MTPLLTVQDNESSLLTDLPGDDAEIGIDDNVHDDPETGATLGGIGGALVGGLAGSTTGPVGAVIGAVAGAAAGSVLSGAAVGAIDHLDDDNTISGIGDNPVPDITSTTGNPDNNYGNESGAGVGDDTNASPPDNKTMLDDSIPVLGIKEDF